MTHGHCCSDEEHGGIAYRPRMSSLRNWYLSLRIISSVCVRVLCVVCCVLCGCMCVLCVYVEGVAFWVQDLQRRLSALKFEALVKHLCSC